MKLHDPENDEGGFEDLIGLCLGLLDEPEPSFDSEANSETEQERVERIFSIRKSLDLLLDDGLNQTVEPPGDLALRTLKRVQSERKFREYHQEPLMHSPRWRWTDLAVAASILFAMFLGTIPAMQRSRFMASNMACSTNLLQLWRGAEHYSSTFNAYPNAVAHNRQLPVGASLILMNHTGHLDEDVSLTCPCCSNQLQIKHLPKWIELQRRDKEFHEQLSRFLAEAYAVHPGLNGPNGSQHLQTQMIASYRSIVPLFGDCPPTDGQLRILQGNSRAHSGYGQNLVFADGHTTFARKRSIGKGNDDIYSSNHGRIEPPDDPREMILVPAGLRLIPR